MRKTYTHQQLQEYLAEQNFSPGAIRQAISDAMQNVSHSSIIRLPFRQKLIRFISHDKFEVD